MNKINQWAKQNTWLAKMNASKGLDGWNNFSGSCDHADWVMVLSRSRDAEILEESNFESTLEQLGGEGKNVCIERFGHWACGWIETIMVNPKSKRLIKKAYEIKQSLENYPVLDDSDYSDREIEYQSEYAEDAKEDLAQALAKHFDLKYSKSLVNLAYDLNMTCQSYYGNDSCIKVYTSRSPDARDIEQLKTCVRDIAYNYKTSKVFLTLVKKLGVELK